MTMEFMGLVSAPLDKEPKLVAVFDTLVCTEAALPTNTAATLVLTNGILPWSGHHGAI